MTPEIRASRLQGQEITFEPFSYRSATTTERGHGYGRSNDRIERLRPERETIRARGMTIDLRLKALV
jgi:hypothetical protein